MAELKKVRTHHHRKSMHQVKVDHRKQKTAQMIHGILGKDTYARSSACTDHCKKDNMVHSDQRSRDKDSECEKENFVNGRDQKLKVYSSSINKNLRFQRRAMKATKTQGLTTIVDRSYDEDEKERMKFLEQKRNEKAAKIEKDKTLQRMREAWKLAKMHYSLILLRRYFSYHWLSFVEERCLKMQKAANVRRDSVLYTFVHKLTNKVKDRTSHTLELQGNRYLQAGA